MSNNSTPKPPSRKVKANSKNWPAGKPKKPYPTFPLTPHISGRWQKKIRNKIFYFGAWAKRVKGQLVRVENDGWQEALEEYKTKADDLHAGRIPRDKTGEPALDFICSHFLTHKLRRLGLLDEDILKLKDLPSFEWLPFLIEKVGAGSHRISPRMCLEYKHTADRLITKFGKARLICDLTPDDFASLGTDLERHYGPARRGNEVQKTRTIFKHAFDFRLIKAPMDFGPGFAKPTKAEYRKNRASKPKKILTPEQLRRLINAADVQTKAMVLLGINAALGNHDIANLSLSVLNLENHWLTYPRPKTGIPRRCALWPETVQALQDAMTARMQPQAGAENLVFITARGRPWLVRGIANPVSVTFTKLLKTTGLHQAGLGFYTLRHVFRTVADGTKDISAVRLVMGHADRDIDNDYREEIEDGRLVAVSEYVRAWLFGGTKKETEEKPTLRVFAG